MSVRDLVSREDRHTGCSASGASVRVLKRFRRHITQDTLNAGTRRGTGTGHEAQRGRGEGARDRVRDREGETRREERMGMDIGYGTKVNADM